jgi:hypothetical protein
VFFDGLMGEKVNGRSEAEEAAKLNVARRFCLPYYKLIYVYTTLIILFVYYFFLVFGL